MLCQHWRMLGKVVAMLGFWSKYNVGTMFTQCCLGVHTTLLGPLKISANGGCHNMGGQHWQEYCDNGAAMSQAPGGEATVSLSYAHNMRISHSRDYIDAGQKPNPVNHPVVIGEFVMCFSFMHHRYDSAK